MHSSLNKTIDSYSQAIFNLGEISGRFSDANEALLATSSILRTVFEASFSLNNFSQSLNRFIAISTTLSKNTDLNPALLERIHRQVFSNPESYQFDPGVYRSNRVSTAIQDLSLGLQGHSIFEQAVHFYLEFLKMKPFKNGNEVLAMLAANYILVQEGLVRMPVIDFSDAPSDLDRVNEWFKKKSGALLEFLSDAAVLTNDYNNRVNGFHKQRKELFRALLPIMIQQSSFTTDMLLKMYGQSTFQTINSLLKELVRLNILIESTGKARNRIFHLREYSQLLKKHYGKL